MPKMLILGRGGAINAERVVAIAHAKSAPIDRMIQARDAGMVVNLTYGYPRRSVLIMDNGFVVVCSQTLENLVRALGDYEELSDDETPTDG